MTTDGTTEKSSGPAVENKGLEIDRRGLLVAAATTVGVGLDIAISPKVSAATASSSAKIDAHTHFTPLKFLEFAEKTEGRPFGLSPLLKSKPALTSVAPRIDLLDRNGIDMHVLVPVPWIEGFPKVYVDPTLATQAARIMNDELAAVVAAHPTRFRGVAILPTVDPDAMVAELHRAVTQLGFVGAYVAVGPSAKRMDHPDYEHLYKALVELDAALWLHPARPPSIADYTDEKLSQYYEWCLVGWPYDTTSAMFRIVFAGVFDRYPTLRIVTHHHGAFIPLLAPRLANVWPLMEPVGLPMPTKISKPYLEHFRNFYCDTAACGFAPKALELAVDFFGPEKVVFGSDAPFDIQDGQIFTSETLRSIDTMAVSPETRAAILSKNAARLLKL
jgi:predicted TIM-barrel fold metal-dependent hydrolase